MHVIIKITATIMMHIEITDNVGIMHSFQSRLFNRLRCICGINSVQIWDDCGCWFASSCNSAAGRDLDVGIVMMLCNDIIKMDHDQSYMITSCFFFSFLSFGLSSLQILTMNSKSSNYITSMSYLDWVYEIDSEVILSLENPLLKGLCFISALDLFLWIGR